MQTNHREKIFDLVCYLLLFLSFAFQKDYPIPYSRKELKLIIVFFKIMIVLELLKI